MGWEQRHGRRYLYRNRRVNGKPVKEYVAADDPLGFGRMMADTLGDLLRGQAEARHLERGERARRREGIDGLLGVTAAANADLRALVEGAMHALGYHRHHRGNWRMKRELALLRGAIQELERRTAERKPLVNYPAPATDSEAVELFAKARAGDADAQRRVVALIRERKWADWIGDLGHQATRQLIHKAAGGDPVWAAGITEKADDLLAELLGPNPTALERLLARRVVNGWVATHALELELTLRPPVQPRERAHLDAALTRAQKRMGEALRDLARVRATKAPMLFAQLNLAAAQTVVNTPATAGIAPPGETPGPAQLPGASG